ncbi:carbohydrate esterase family 8 protein [Athelia psychrophila]|uniref:Pectinesterase n=1 Tax=Athelia psychrophila TaxID=1759441 RepID=A0A166EZE9_9AGAM|nr:carbohydrate esterase family 8 protein [Fibularhizoctonia sp. CBS 109695]
MHFPILLSCFALFRLVLAASTPPSGALTVGSSGTYKTVSAALAAAKSGATIFIYSGTYSESVYFTTSGITIYGETTDASSYTSNTVTITAKGSAATDGSDDASGTFRVHANSFKMYNVNVVNSYGVGSQALALSAYGTEQGFYGCSFVGWQDTVLTDSGTQFFGSSYIEGSVDFIFGQTANSYFYASVIAPKTTGGTITASGPASSSVGIYVFDSCYIEAAASATTSLTGKVFLGRPWTEYARAVFKYCSLSSIINSAGWEEWSTATPNTADVVFAEYDNNGSGATTSGRASFSKQLTSTTVGTYSIANILGSGYASWVDAAYL